MRKDFCYTFLLLIIPGFFSSAQSQPDRFAYAVTAIQKDGTAWVALRKLNTQTGEFSNVLLNGMDKNRALYDATTLQQVDNFVSVVRNNNNPQLAFGTSVAAIAYDRQNNRLYYTPMYIDQLRYIDLSTMKVFCVTNQSFSKAGNFNLDPGNPITRMVIAPDGYGYTVTNDGDHLIRFTTNGRSIITDLGPLTDDPHNNEMTIHNPCGNAGGDLVADDAGQLYLVSSSNRVYKIDVGTRQTIFLATISGLPQKFSTNGAAVDESGKLLVSSSLYKDAYFVVDPKTWNASPSPRTTTEMYGSADLANSNTLITKTTGYSKRPWWASPNRIKLYPNPVNDEFNIQFNDLKPGNYTIQVNTVLDRRVLLHKVTITSNGQTETIRFPGSAAQGLYVLRILDENNKTVTTQKLVVER